MVEFSSPLLSRDGLELTPNGYYGADRPSRKGTHHGIDFVADLGDPVVAVVDGMIDRVGWDPPYPEGHGGGLYAIQTFEDGGELWELGYFHLETRLAQAGNMARAGDAIGQAGRSGTVASGAHLHVQLRRIVGGVKVPEDPTSRFPAILWSVLPSGGNAGGAVLVALLVLGALALWG